MYINAEDLLKSVEADKELHQKISQALPNLPKPLESDVWIYRVVVVALGLALCGSIGGAVALVLNGKEVPKELIALGSAAVGALAGLLAPSPVTKK